MGLPSEKCELHSDHSDNSIGILGNFRMPRSIPVFSTLKLLKYKQIYK